MVVPIIAGGAAILAFVTWGKDIFGESTFKKILHAGIALGVLGIIYIAYKAYRAWTDVKEAGEDAVEKVTKKITDSWDWVYEGLENKKKDIEEDIDWWADTPGIEILKAGGEKVVDATPEFVKDVYNTPRWIIEGGRDIAIDKTIDIYNSPKWIIESTRDKVLDKLKFW